MRASNLLLPQRRVLLEFFMVRISTTLNQQGTHNMKEDVLSSAREQDLGTNGYGLSDLGEVAFFGKTLCWRQMPSLKQEYLPHFPPEHFVTCKFEHQQITSFSSKTSCTRKIQQAKLQCRTVRLKL